MQLNAKDIKALLTQDDVASILRSVGIEVSNTYTFKLRDERTPSAVINKDGSLHDYGANFHGDILDALQEAKNLTFKEALEVVASHIGTTQSAIVIPRADMKPKKEYISELSDEVHEQMLNTLKWYDSQKELQTFKNPDYKKEALSICPLWVYQQAKKESLEEFKRLTTFDNKNKTLVIKIHDYQNKLISYKRRRLNIGKWITAKGTHPNKQCLVRNKAKTDKEGNFLNHIYILEGVHDALTAILLDIDFLMIQTIGYKSFTEYEISLLKNRDVIFIADYAVKDKKEDLAGVDAMRNLARQIGSVARNAKVLSLKLFLESQSIPFDNDKLDLSEVVELWRDGLEPFVNTLECFADKNIFYKSEEIF